MESLSADRDSLCSGCFRTIDEIVQWAGASDDRKRDILAAIARRRPP